MRTIADWQVWVPFLQIQIAVTVVMLAAACLTRFVDSRRVLVREWILRGALVGVLTSMLVPVLNHIAPIAGPELAILPADGQAARELANDRGTTSIDASSATRETAAVFDKSRVDEPAGQHIAASGVTEKSEAASNSSGDLPTTNLTKNLTNLTKRPSVTNPETSITNSVRLNGVSSITPLGWILGILFVGWLTGLFYYLTRGLIGIVICRRIVAAAVPLDKANFEDVLLRLQRTLSLKKLPPISVTSQVGSPAVIGTLRPQVVLPSASLSWMSSAQLFQVLLHESAHVQRHDPFVNGLQVLAQALFWHHPLMNRLNRGLSNLREEICDNFVLAHSDPADYAETLLKMTEKCPRMLPVHGLAMLVEKGALEARVAGLLDEKRDRSIHWPLWRKIATVSVLLLVPLSLGMVRITERTIHADEPKPPVLADKPAPKSEPKPGPSDEGSIKLKLINHAVLAKDVGEFELLVVGPDGKAIPEATVHFYNSSGPTPEQIRRGKFLRKGSYGAFVSADSEGRVTIAIPADSTDLRLTIEIAGYGPYWSEWSSQNQTPQIPARFTAELEAAWSIHGVVVDPDGNPASDVEIHPMIEFKKRPGETSNLSIGTKVTTDATGRWHFDSVPLSKDTVSFSVNKPDFLPVTGSIKRDAKFDQGRDFVLKTVLERGLSVVGKVTDEAGNPIAGARIRTKFVNDIREATTGEDGTYRLLGCQPVMSKIVVSAKGKATDMQQLRIGPQMEPVNFEMKPGGKIRVRVLDENGNPAPKSRIFFQRWRTDFYDYFEFGNVNQYADENGVWEWNEAPLDEFKADICPPNGMQLSKQTLKARAEEYVFRPPTELEVTGKVVDAVSKEPVGKFDVIPGRQMEFSGRFPNKGRRSWNHKGRFTATDGKYRLRPENGRNEYLVRIEATGYRAAVSRNIKLDEGKVTIDFELQKTQDISSVVLVPDGSPAVGAKIAVGIVGTQIDVANGDISQMQSYCAIETTDKAGRFQIVAQDADYQLTFVHPTGFAHLKLTPDEQIAPTLQLQAWARAEGVFRVGGKPVANAPIEIQGVGPNSSRDDGPRIYASYRVRTDDQGRFAFDRVFPGHGRIGREIVMMVVEGATDFTSSCKIPVDFVSGETATFDFPQIGRPVIGRLQNANENTKTDWKQVLVQIEPLLPELPLVEPPKFPAEIANDVNKRRAWLQNWRQTEAGQAYTAWESAKKANDDLFETKSYFRGTLNNAGEFRFDDVPEGEYTIKSLFSRTRQRLSVPPMEGGKSDQPLDLGVLRVD